MSNRLKGQSSPYLLQHAENPVNWYPWCEEAFEKAEKENKPIFLSIGYSTCHWCHVMAEESFENTEIADILNQHYIAIKVDREERPDIDSVYMSVCQALTGSGGWPMSVFMTAKQKPFFAGTYFPPTSRYGGIGFRDLLLGIAQKWQEDSSILTDTAEEILAHIKEERSGQAEINATLPELAVKVFSKIYDKEYGGFGEAPKFPTPHNLLFLTFYAQLYKEDGGEALQMVTKTLEYMRRGGIFDQIGYGFSRYSTDRYYLCPHFEKMLYDNALLIMAYCWGYQASGQKMFLKTAKETAAYVLQEMTGENGEFYSAQDADSEGTEGKFYVWEYEEVLNVLGKEQGEAFCRYYGITKQGNFEGRNIPNLLNGNAITESFEKERKALYAYRNTRARLHLDDKVLTSWNALMISALSALYRVTKEQCYRMAAERACRFLEENLADADQLYVSYRENVRSTKGFLDDYAYYAWALLSLYDATLEEKYLVRARQISAEARRQFADPKGGYFLCGTENQQLITRPKETYDGALPSGNSVMAYVLVRLYSWSGSSKAHQAAEEQLAFLSSEAVAVPHAHSMFLIALLAYRNPPSKITVVLSKQEEAKTVLANLPFYADISLLDHESENYKLLGGKTTYYVCRNHVCLPPSHNYIEEK